MSVATIRHRAPAGGCSRPLRFAPLAAALLTALPAAADGGAFKGRDWTALTPAPEGLQLAAIHHREGIQRMLLAVDFELADDEHAVWLFPIPGTPSGTRLDLVDAFPDFHGRDPRRTAGQAIDHAMALARLTQVWAIAADVFVPTLLRSAMLGESRGAVDRWGMHAELIPADSPDRVVESLASRGARITPDALASFGPYFDGRHSLAAVWITSRAAYEREFGAADGRGAAAHRRPCAYVECPADRAFFPLRPTSMYGDRLTEVRVYVLGHVRVGTAGPVDDLADVRHFMQDDVGANVPEAFAHGLQPGHCRYTRIWFTSRADRFTEDLEFLPFSPPGMAYGEWIDAAARSGVFLPIWAVLVAVLSCVAFAAATRALAGTWRGYWAYGAWNVLTLGALWLVLRRWPSPACETVREIGVGRVVVLFSFLFALLTGVTQWLLHLPLSG